MAGKMPGSLRVHTFSSAACVHAVESFDGGSNPPKHRGATANDKFVSTTEVKKTVKKLLSPLKQKWRIASRSRSKAPASREAAIGMHIYALDESDADTFVSANNSRLSSLCTDDDEDDELSAYRLTPLIFPVGILESPRASASPVKVVQKLPFGYVIGRKLDSATAPPPPSALTLVKKFRKTMSMLADLHLRSRWMTLKKKVVRGRKERFQGGSGQDGRQREDHDDEDVFWKKDVRGLRCRRVEDDDDTHY